MILIIPFNTRGDNMKLYHEYVIENTKFCKCYYKEFGPLCCNVTYEYLRGRHRMAINVMVGIISNELLSKMGHNQYLSITNELDESFLDCYNRITKDIYKLWKPMIRNQDIKDALRFIKRSYQWKHLARF